MRLNPLRALFTLSTVVVLALLMLSSPVRAQQPPPHPAPPAQPAQPALPAAEPVPSFVPIGETYHFEVSVDAWSTLPSTMKYSDTETVTSGTTTTTVVGTNINFKEQLGLHNQWFPAFHVT